VTSPAEIAERQLVAYNAQDLPAFVACYTEDVVIADLNGAVSSTGRDAVEARYAKLFAENPENRVELLGRMSVGAVVIDHERVFRSNTTAPFEVLAIYTVRDGLIARCDFVRAA
jgi:hypothetical protein